MAEDAKQDVSWFRKYGHRSYPGLIAQIYFPTAVDALDGDDKAVLDVLAETYIIVMLGARKVALKLIGRADYRGTESSNTELGFKRARSIETYLNGRMKSSTYLSMSVESAGESGASANFLSGDRRVDIISSYIPKRPPIVLPEVKIVGKRPPKMVSRPVQILDIAYTRLVEDGPHGAESSSWHVIVIEKYEMVDERATLPLDSQSIAWKQHSIFPPVNIRRWTCRWRQPTTADTAKSVGKTVWKILAGAFGTAGPGDDPFPKVAPPNVVHKSWDEYQARNPTSEMLQYRGPAYTWPK